MATIDLATLILKGTVDEEELQLYAEKGQLDIPDKDGRTPLMIACLKGLEDTVKFLLANGANPNSKCFKEGNTPMHYACIVEELKEENALYGRNYNPSKWMTCKVAIIKLLLSSGALAVQENLYGWSPPCLAALYMLKDIVDIFLEEDALKIPLEVKIKITEILGVSLTALDQTFSDFEGAFSSFSQALKLQEGATFPRAQVKTSELAACFLKCSMQECHTADEIKSVEESRSESNAQCETGLQAHAFLVGDRVFPKKFKQKYLYPSLIAFGIDLMWNIQMHDEGRQILSCGIGFEHHGELKLGLVAENLAEISRSFSDEQEEPNDQYLWYVRDLLCEYESVLNHVPMDSLFEHSGSLMDSFGDILYHDAFYCCLTIDSLISTLQTIEKSVRVIRGRIRKERPDKYHELLSVTYKVMDLLANEMLKTMYGGGHVLSRSICRVKFIIFKTLLFENASSCRDRNRGGTLLHLVCASMPGPRHLEHFTDLASEFVHHGCPIDLVNNDGHTARDELLMNWMYDLEGDLRLYNLVSPPTTVLTLEEVAIRAILHHDLIYQDILPPTLCTIIESGLKDCDLVSGGEDSSDEEDRPQDEPVHYLFVFRRHRTSDA